MLSVLLSWRAAEYKDEVFTSVFALSWVGTMIVTWQIRLLGGKMQAWFHVLLTPD